MDPEKERTPEAAPVPNESFESQTASAPESGAPEATYGDQDHTVAMLCHLLSFTVFIGFPLGNILAPLILWLVKKDEDAFVDSTGKEVLNFQISVTIYGIICALSFLIFIGVVLLPLLVIAAIIYTIIGALKAKEGELYRYPFTIRFLK